MVEPIKPRAFKVSDDPPRRSQPEPAPSSMWGLERDGVQRSTGMALYRGRDDTIYRRRNGGGWDQWDPDAMGENGAMGAYVPIEPRVIRDRQAGVNRPDPAAQQAEGTRQTWMDGARNLATRGVEMVNQARSDLFRSAAAGQERIPGVNEIGWQTIPSEQQGVGGFLDSTRRGAAVAGSRFLNATDEAYLQQLLRNNPNLEISTDEEVLPRLKASGAVPQDFEIPRQEGEPPRILVRHGPEGEWGYLNAPGVSAMELLQMGNDVVKYFPVTRMASAVGSTALRRIGLAAAGGAAVENISEAAGEGLQVGEYSPARATATGLVAGGVGQAADEVITPLLRAGGATARQRLPGGQTRPPAPDLPPVTNRSPEAALGRAAASQEQGIPLTRGQTTQRVSDLDLEARAARGSMGDRAAQVMNQRLAEQRRAAEAAAQRIVRGGATETDDEAAALINDTVRRMQTQSQQNVDELWTNARAAAQEDYGAGGRVSASAGSRLRTLQNQATRTARVERGAVIDDPAMAPNATRINAILDDVAKQVEAGQLGLNDIDIYRKQIANYRRQAMANPEAAMDQIVSIELSRAFDDWMDGLLGQGAYSGDGAILAQFRQARAATRRHHQEFGVDGPQDSAGRWIEQRLNVDADDATTLQGVFNARGMPTTRSQPIVRRLRGIYARRAGVKPDGSRRELAAQQPAFEAMRETALRRALRDLAPDDAAGAKFTPRSVVTRFGQWLENTGFLRELFDADEITQLKRIHKLMEQMLYDNALTNPSGTADALFRAMNRSFGNFDSPMQALLRRVVGLAFDMGDQITDASARQVARNVGGPSGYRPAPGVGPSAAAYAAGVAGADDLRRQQEQRREQ